DRAGERPLGRHLAAEDLADDLEGLAHQIEAVARPLDDGAARRGALEDADVYADAADVAVLPRHHRHGHQPAVAHDLQLDPLAGAFLDIAHEVAAGGHRIAVDGADLIARAQPRLVRRSAGEDAGDLRPEARIHAGE